jgi:hypothetical protein
LGGVGLPAEPKKAFQMPKALDRELEFRLLEAADRIKKGGSIDVQQNFDGFDVKDVNRAMRNLTERGLLRTYDARHLGGRHWYIMALTAVGQAELQAQREDRARPALVRAWRWLVGLDWEWALPVLIAVIGLFALGLTLPQLGAVLLSVLLG